MPTSVNEQQVPRSQLSACRQLLTAVAAAAESISYIIVVASDALM